jgi:hypothetical protein
MGEPELKNTTTELELARPTEAMSDEDPIGLFKLAIESKAGADTLERVMAVRRELRAERAQEAFESALSDFQAGCPVILKNKGVKTNAGTVAYKFAPIEDVEAVIRPIEKLHGFNHTFDTDAASAQGWVIAKCIVTHRSGHSRTSTMKLPLGGKTQIMSDTQQFAAALTFANRRALCNAYGLVLVGEDFDGAGRIKPAGPSTKQADTWTRDLAMELWKLLPEEVAGRNPNWSKAKQYLTDENFITPEEHGGDAYAPVFGAERYRQVIEKVKERVRFTLNRVL